MTWRAQGRESHRRCRQKTRMSDSFYSFDVIVIGGGHAAPKPRSLASARAGARTLPLTHAIEPWAR